MAVTSCSCKKMRLGRGWDAETHQGEKKKEERKKGKMNKEKKLKGKKKKNE